MTRKQTPPSTGRGGYRRKRRPGALFRIYFFLRVLFKSVYATPDDAEQLAKHHLRVVSEFARGDSSTAWAVVGIWHEQIRLKQLLVATRANGGAIFDCLTGRVRTRFGYLPAVQQLVIWRRVLNYAGARLCDA